MASWNVENLFDLQRQGTEYEEYIPGRHGWNETMLRKKLRNIAEVICDLDADFIGLQEVESDRVLARLQRLLKRVGCPYPYRAIATGEGRAVHVAALSRVKIGRKREIAVSRYGRERHILELTLATAPPLKIFINHWRSKRGPESERVRYAKALRRRLQRLAPGTAYLLLGDFNSDYREYRILDRKHNDTGGITGINQILRTIDRRGRLIRVPDLRRCPPGTICHMNLWLELESAKRWSHNFFGDKEAIDAILIPPTLVNGRGWEYLPGSFGVYRPAFLFGRYGEVKRWAYRHGKHQGRGFSDHLPIYARLETSDGGATLKTLPKMTNDFPKRTIAWLRQLGKLESPVRLEKVTLVFRRGADGVLQQGKNGAAILLYGSARGLEEGGVYDVTVYGVKRYRGMPEVTDLEPDRRLGKVSPEAYIPAFRPEMMRERRWRSHVVRSMAGRYDGSTLRWGVLRIPIHFKKRSWRPETGSYLKITRAQIGYYKDHTELVVWDRSDFEIVRK